MTSARRSHEHTAALARAGHIDTTAPVTATASTPVAAPAHVVWNTLADIPSWPTFIPGVSKAAWSRRVPGPQAGVIFRWRNAGVSLTSTLQVCSPGEELTWTGRAAWVTAIHRNTIAGTSHDECVLTASESMSGFGIARVMPPSRLAEQLRAFVDAVAAEAVRRCD